MKRQTRQIDRVDLQRELEARSAYCEMFRRAGAEHFLRKRRGGWAWLDWLGVESEQRSFKCDALAVLRAYQSDCARLASELRAQLTADEMDDEIRATLEHEREASARAQRKGYQPGRGRKRRPE